MLHFVTFLVGVIRKRKPAVPLGVLELHGRESDADDSEDDADYEVLQNEDDEQPWESITEDPPDVQIAYQPTIRPALFTRVVVPKLAQPAYDGHVWTLDQFIQDILCIGIDGNVSNATQQKYFKAIRRHLPAINNFPSFELAKKMIRERSGQVLREIPVCWNDCETYPEHAGSNVSKLAELQLQCSTCGTSIVNKKQEVKVSVT